jgi:LysM repeat protein
MFGYATRLRGWAVLFLLLALFLPAPAAAQSGCGPSVVLRFGETIADVSRRCGFSVSDIMAANPLLPNQYFVFPGLTIQLPAPPPPPPPPVDETIRYVVRPGDTLSSIARVHGLTLVDIYRFNPDVDARTLRVGDVLFLPGFVAPPPPPPPPVNTVNYTVRPGDTLYYIARANNMTIAEIYELNPGLDPRFLRVGDVIRLRSGVINPPPPPSAGETIVLSPTSGRTGTVVEITVSGYPRNAELRLLAGTRRSRLSEIQTFSVNRRGRATLEVRIPNWAVDSPRFYFATELLDGGRRITSEAFRITSGNQANTVTVDGTLTREGVQCPAMRGDDGRLYTLAGDITGLRAGDRVRVVGRVVEASICQQGTTIELQAITGLN